MEIEGNFTGYTSTSKPISAVIEIFYGSSVPAGSMYFQDSAGADPGTAAGLREDGWALQHALRGRSGADHRKNRENRQRTLSSSLAATRLVGRR